MSRKKPSRRKRRSWWSLFLNSTFFANPHSPWDRGVLEAHWMHSVRTQQIQEIQARAARQRRGLLARVWPRRRLYLDGLLWGIAKELHRRS